MERNYYLWLHRDHFGYYRFWSTWIMKHANTGNKNAMKTDEEKATSTLICRINPKIKAAWVKSAQKEGKKLSQWVTDTLNANVTPTS